MILDFNSIPKFCISLKRSRERRDLVQLEFKRAGLVVEFFDAIDREEIVVPELCDKENKTAVFPHAPGIYACMMSHRELFKKASKLKLPAICVFEDDVILCDGFWDRIRYVEQSRLDFDVFSLGGHFSNTIQGAIGACGQETAWNHIFRVVSMGGSYGYIITREVYEFCIRNLTYNYGMDQFLSDVVYKRFACYAFVPFLVGCRPCKSEITGAYGEYENVKWFYQQEAIEDFSVPYRSPHQISSDIAAKQADEFRKKTLDNEQN